MNVDESQILPSVRQWVDELVSEVRNAPARMDKHREAMMKIAQSRQDALIALRKVYTAQQLADKFDMSRANIYGLLKRGAEHGDSES